MATVVDSSSLAKFVALHHTDGTCVIIPSACNAAYSFNMVSIPGGSINLWKTSVRQLFFVLLKTANQPLICSKSRISRKFQRKSKLRCWTSSIFFHVFVGGTPPSSCWQRIQLEELWTSYFPCHRWDHQTCRGEISFPGPSKQKCNQEASGKASDSSECQVWHKNSQKSEAKKTHFEKPHFGMFVPLHQQWRLRVLEYF